MDNGLERIAYSRKRMSYMPNIYVVGQDGFQRFCQVFYTMSYEMLGRLEGRGISDRKAGDKAIDFTLD